jgi:glycosyltransferase involved in cell wall biosynthesis
MAVVTTAHAWGDPRVFERELATCLGWGVETHVFVPLPEPPQRSGWSADPRLVVHPLPVPGRRLARFRLALGVWREVLRAGPFALVQFHDPELVPAMALLGILRPGTYTLYDIHEDLALQVASKAYLPAWARFPCARLTGWMLRSARELFSGFAPATEAIARDWPEAQTRVVHNYPKALFGLGSHGAPDPHRVLYVGGLCRERGILLALEAVRAARRELPDLRLELIGWVMDGDTARAIRVAAAEGWCEHVPKLAPDALQARAAGAGVGLVTLLPRPNYLESLPTKLFEYMAMGIPVLASDFPLWRQLVEQAGCGRLAAPATGAVARALVAMCSDPGQLRRYGEAGRAAYRERYRWEAEASRLRWHLRESGLLGPRHPLEPTP